MIVTYFFLFVAVYAAWTFIAAPLRRVMRMHSAAYVRFEQNLPLGAIKGALEKLDALGAQVPLPIAIGLIIASVIGEVRAIHSVATYLPSDRAIEHGWPISFIITNRYFAHYGSPAYHHVRIVLAALVAVQVLSLRMLCSRYAKRAPRGFDWVVLGIGAIGVYGFGLFSHTMEQPDLYAYVVISKLGFTAYAPPILNKFSGDFAQLDPIVHVAWGLQNYPYGPLWIALSHLIIGHASHLFTALIFARALATMGIAVLAWAVYRLGYGWPGALLVVFNPAIIHEYLVEGHNDILAVALVALGFVATRRSSLLGLLFVVAAGLVKIPYGIVGTLAFVSIDAPVRRIGYAIGAFIVTAVLSLVFGGQPYLASMRLHADVTSHGQPFGVLTARAIILAFVGVALIAALLFRRTRPVAAYACPQLAVTNYPWYVILGLPYALLDVTGLPIFLNTLPATVMLNDIWFGGNIVFAVSIAGAVGIALSARGSGSAQPVGDIRVPVIRGEEQPSKPKPIMP